MKITERQLRQIINEELRRINEVSAVNPVGASSLGAAGKYLKGKIQENMVDPILDKVETALRDYLINNAESLADQMVPTIPLDGDILENFAKEIVTETLTKKADEIAKCARGLMDPEIVNSAQLKIT